VTVFSGDARELAIRAFEAEMAAVDPSRPVSVPRNDYRRALALWLIDELSDPLKPLAPPELACRSWAEATVVTCDNPTVEAWAQWERAAAAYRSFKGR
jgi:hypothetical protein